MREGYQAELKAAQDPITAKYLKQLDAMMRKFGGEGDLKNAQAIKDEIDRMSAKPEKRPAADAAKTANEFGVDTKANPSATYGGFEYHVYLWSSGQPPVKMIAANEGFCYLSEVGGHFQGFGEYARVVIQKDGYWYLTGGASVPDLVARAIAVKTPR